MSVKFEILLLHTAFCCMACDGEIVASEVNFIKTFALNSGCFGEISIEEELNRLTKEINIKGKSFLKEYLYELSQVLLTEEQELILLQVAAQMIKADEIVQYNEILFFKIIRSELKVSNKTILEHINVIDKTFLANDIHADYILYENYFNNVDLPQFSIDKFVAAK